MRNLVYSLVLGLSFLTNTAYADVIQGGSRQQYDSVHCSTYQPVWEEFNRYVASIPTTYKYGPEAPVPLAPADGPISDRDPQATAAVDRWTLFSSLNAAYAGAGGETTLVIGYDQLYSAFSIVDQSLVGQTGPQLPMPKLTDYLPMTVERHRAWTIAIDVWSLSFYRVLSEFQLRAIHTVMLQTPTCNGLTY